MREWKRNAFRCKKCGMIVESKSVHDFQECECGNFTDGGLDYIRRGGKMEDMEDLSEPHAYFGKRADTLFGDRFAEKEKCAVGTFNKVGKLEQQSDNTFTVAEINKEMNTTYEDIVKIVEGKADMANEVLASEIHFAEKVIREYQIAVLARLKTLSLEKKEKQNG